MISIYDAFDFEFSNREASVTQSLNVTSNFERISFFSLIGQYFDVNQRILKIINLLHLGCLISCKI